MKHRSVIVMGVSGAGKSTIGREIAERCGATFIDADDLHDTACIAKMLAGIPLDDDDRWPWLDRVAEALCVHAHTVIACSALTRRYRDRLRDGAPGTIFLHLDVAADRVHRQLDARAGHFMPGTLLQSQLETLEPLGADEPGVTVLVDADVTEIVDRAARLLREL